MAKKSKQQQEKKVEEEPQVLAKGSVQQFELAEALRKVVPFTAGEKEYRDNLKHVWFEAKDGTLELTTADGSRIAHVTLQAAWPDGQWLLDGSACKQLSYAYSQGEVAVEVYEAKIVVGQLTVPVVDTKWVEYRKVYDEVQANAGAMLIVAKKVLNKALKQATGNIVGLRVSQKEGCRLYVAKEDRREYTTETVGHAALAVQVATGDARAAFDLDRLRKAMSHCGDSVTLKLQGEGKPALVEGTGYWHILASLASFPKEVTFSQSERQALEWVEEMLKSIRRGEVQAVVRLNKGGMQVSWEPQPEATNIAFEQEPAPTAAAAS